MTSSPLLAVVTLATGALLGGKRHFVLGAVGGLAAYWIISKQAENSAAAAVPPITT